MPLPRLQLFELEDLPWWPRVIRDYATDYLQYMDARLALHAPMFPILAELVKQTQRNRIVDLCSGGGGPVVELQKLFEAEGADVRFMLTDRYPSAATLARVAAGCDTIEYDPEPVDARAVPERHSGVRTLFNAFHHFAPDDARSILASAAAADEPIAIFEISDRTWRTLLPLLFTPFYVAIATPFMRPFKWSRLVWTYLIPLVPLTCWWDGLVSQFRTYTVGELEELSNTIGNDSYTWDVGRVKIGRVPGFMTYLVGSAEAPRRGSTD